MGLKPHFLLDILEADDRTGLLEKLDGAHHHGIDVGGALKHTDDVLPRHVAGISIDHDIGTGSTDDATSARTGPTCVDLNQIADLDVDTQELQGSLRGGGFNGGVFGRHVEISVCFMCSEG